MSNNKSIEQAINQLDKRIQSAIWAGVKIGMTAAAAELAESGEKELHQSIDHIGTYKPYIDSYGNPRVSSAPGEAPSSAAGNPLDVNIYHRHISSKGSNPAVAEFGVNGEIAHFLEFGTPKMQPRPFLRPAKQKIAREALDVTAFHFLKAVIGKFKKQAGTTITVVMK
jgi:HK97 gp10 family phage protein